MGGEEEDLGMENLAEHYERLLGLDGDWQMLDGELVLEGAADGDPVGVSEESGGDAQTPFGSDTELVLPSYKQRHGRGI